MDCRPGPRLSVQLYNLDRFSMLSPWGAQHSASTAVLGAPHSGGWERRGACGTEKRGALQKGGRGAVVTYKLEFWRHLTLWSGTTGKAHSKRRSQMQCQISPACACLPDWTRTAKGLAAIVSEPINRLGELRRRKCGARG